MQELTVIKCLAVMIVSILTRRFQFNQKQYNVAGKLYEKYQHTLSLNVKKISAAYAYF